MIEINLLPEELKNKQAPKKEGQIKAFKGIDIKKFILIIPLVFGILICLHIYLVFVGMGKQGQLRKLTDEWVKFEPERKKLEVFKKEFSVLTQDRSQIKALTENRVNWSEKLNKLSLNLPYGIWFNELNVTTRDFNLQGSALSLEKEEMNLISKLIDSLKKDPEFAKDFSTLEVSSVQKRNLGSYEIADFILIGAMKAK